MVRAGVVLAVVGLCAACSSSQTGVDREPEPAAPEPTAEVEPPESLASLDLPDDHVVVEITARGGGPRIAPPGQPPPSYGPSLIASIQWDGHAQWSDDHRRGGEPLHSGTVDAERLRAFIDELRRDRVFDDAALNRNSFGPDATFIQIEVDIGSQSLQMASWHEVEDPTRTIATASGLTGLNGRDPADVLAAQPEDYRRFVEQWAAIRAAVDDLLP